MEVLIEVDVVAEMRIVLMPRLVAEDGPSAVLIPQEDARQSQRQLVCDIVDRRKVAGAGRTCDAKVIAVVVMKLLQRLDDEEIHGKPDGPAPVGVAAEESAVGLCRLIAHREIHAIVAIHVRLFLVYA